MIGKFGVMSRPVHVSLKKQPRVERHSDYASDEQLAHSIYSEFVSKFLESLNIESTGTHRRKVQKHLPLHDCLISGNWSSKGDSAVASALTIKPKVSSEPFRDFRSPVSQPPFAKIDVSVPSSTPPPSCSSQDVSQSTFSDKKTPSTTSLAQELSKLRATRNSHQARLAQVAFASPEIVDAFILPFAAFMDDKIFSWHATDVFDFRSHLQDHGEMLGDLTETLSFTIEEILDFARQKIDFIQVDEPLAKLAGLFTHFVYWQNFRFLHTDNSLAPKLRHALLHSMLRLWKELSGNRTLLLVAVKVLSREMLLQTYPALATRKLLKKRLEISISVAGKMLFDPDDLLARLPELSGTSKGVLLENKLGKHDFIVHKVKRVDTQLEKVNRVSVATATAFAGPEGTSKMKTILRKNGKNHEQLEWWIQDIDANAVGKFAAIPLEKLVVPNNE